MAELQSRVAERRRSGAYPPGLEAELDAHFQRIQERRSGPLSAAIDLRTPLQEVGQSLPFSAAAISTDSAIPVGGAVHHVVARVVGRQTQGVLRQVQQFASAVGASLAALTEAVERLQTELRHDLSARMDWVLDHASAQEQESASLRRTVDELASAAADANSRLAQLEAERGLRPWFDGDRFEERFRGTREDLLDRYRVVAERLVDHGPVLDLGCGRGEFLELLGVLGVEASGIELDLALVKETTERGLAVEHGDGLAWLEGLADGSLGALVLIQVIEHLSQQGILDLVALAARKLRPGGQLLVETVNPQSLYVYAHAFYLDPTHTRPVHPAYLTFLFEEAGFGNVTVEWRSPPPAADVLEEIPASRKSDAVSNANARRVNELLFAPQDYLLVGTR